MIQEILWGVSFLGLWLTLTWLNFLYLRPARSEARRLPHVTVVMPCYNRENTLEKTVRSLMALDYPQEKIQLIIVDDGSTDGTAALARQLQQEFPGRLEMMQQANGGKDSALNAALAVAKGELFTCVDSDSRVEPQSLRRIIPHFEDAKTGAVISVIKVDEPRNVYEHIQRIEYIFSNLVRRIMSAIDTLFVTPGVLSVYRTSILRELGGWGGGAMTEDLEIALRLRNQGYRVLMEPRAITHTKVPATFTHLWSQRIRWFRGFMFNHWKYRRMFLNPRHGMFGMFQFPINVFGVVLLLVTLVLVGFGIITDTYEFLYRSITIPSYFLNHVFDMPTLQELILGQNVQIILPLVASLVLGLYLLYVAHRELRERLVPYVHFIWLYMLVFPYVTGAHWIVSIYKEAKGARRKW